jgi:sugar phosphate isomerase/epimerase
MGEIELLALYWTTSGPTEVHHGREWSLFSWRDRCAQAAAVGFAGIGIWHADLEHQLETTSMNDIKQVFDEAGLSYLELEFLADFFLPAGEPALKESDRRRALLFEAAHVLGAHHIKVGNIPGAPCELARLTEAFAEVCVQAAEHTDAKVVYEFMPFDVNVNTLDTALQLVRQAGQRNGGLAVDTWHMAKLGIPPEELAQVPRDYLSWVELSDGQYESLPDLVDETINHRRLPGEGEFDIPAYVEACREAGYTGPWGVEVLSAELRSLPIDEEFTRAYTTTAAQFHTGALT